MSARDLFAEVAGTYDSFSQLEAKLIEVYQKHFAEFPTLFGMSNLLEFARDQGWIQASDDSLRVSIQTSSQVPG